MSTHNIYFHQEIKKKYQEFFAAKSTLCRVMISLHVGTLNMLKTCFVMMQFLCKNCKHPISVVGL